MNWYQCRGCQTFPDVHGSEGWPVWFHKLQNKLLKTCQRTHNVLLLALCGNVKHSADSMFKAPKLAPGVSEVLHGLMEGSGLCIWFSFLKICGCRGASASLSGLTDGKRMHDGKMQITVGRWFKVAADLWKLCRAFVMVAHLLCWDFQHPLLIVCKAGAGRCTQRRTGCTMAIHTNGQSQDDHQSSSANTNTINTAIREGQLIYLPAKEFQFVTTTAIRQPRTI